MSGYTPTEIEKIGGWLRDGKSASQIAAECSSLRGKPLSRNAIIGIVHRNKTLRAIGFDRSKAGAHGGRPKGSSKREPASVAAPMPKAARVIPKCPAPYQLPGKLFIAAIEEIDREGEAFRLKSPAISRPPMARQSHFVAMRFVDCLFDRCRAPLSSDLYEKPGPDMLCCGFRVEFGKSYCTYHEIRLTNRQREFEAVAA